MRLEKMADKVLETDVLVIGGGVSGCVAAAKAAKLGAEVIVLEKASLERGGGPAAGWTTVRPFPMKIPPISISSRDDRRRSVPPHQKQKRGCSIPMSILPPGRTLETHSGGRILGDRLQVG